MPRFTFRRKSNQAEDLRDEPTEPSFRVIERPDSGKAAAGGIGNGKGFESSARFSMVMGNHHHGKTHVKATTAEVDEDTNLFAGMNPNRGSGSSNTTKTGSDNSSRHSNASTAPSSMTDMAGHEDWKSGLKRPTAESHSSGPAAIAKHSAGGFLKQAAGRTFSFGMAPKKAYLPPTVTSAEEEVASASASGSTSTSTNYSTSVLGTNSSPNSLGAASSRPVGRSRAETTSTVTTATAPRLDDGGSLIMDMGGDLSNVLDFNKRASTATLTEGTTKDQDKDDDRLDFDRTSSTIAAITAAAITAGSSGSPRNLTGNRVGQPAPLNLKKTAQAQVDPPPDSWNSQHSTDELMGSRDEFDSHNVAMPENSPPPVPVHRSHLQVRTLTASPPLGRIERVDSPEADEDAQLLSETAAAARFLSGDASSPDATHADPNLFSQRNGLHPHSLSPGGGYQRMDQASKSNNASNGRGYQAGNGGGDELFDSPEVSRQTKIAPRYRSYTQPHNKVMTPGEFEKYRNDKAKEQSEGIVPADEDDEEEISYDDDEDDKEKTKQMAKQRRKQEAHMAVYRQQMMKVTGESSTSVPVHRPGMSMSMSTPNLSLKFDKSPSADPSGHSEGSVEEDEDVPLGILAAHGFPSKNRPPTRLSTFGSNPNLRAAMQPSFSREGQGANGQNGQNGQNGPAPGGPLPAFARKLPQDPFVGAGLVNQPTRESFHMGAGSMVGGAPPQQPPPQPRATGGLVGVIMNEERQRAMRRGSPNMEGARQSMLLPNHMGGSMGGGLDPMNGIPPHMMYPGGLPPQQQGGGMTMGDHAQLQMTQQMTQFMQMQMQFMSMMTGQNPGQPPQQPMGRPSMGHTSMGHMPSQSMSAMPDAIRQSMFLGGGPGPSMDHRNSMFMGGGADQFPMHNALSPMAGSQNGPPSPNHLGGNLGFDSARADTQARTMSLVQPSSGSWMPPVSGAGYAPSIRIQGNNYTPSIAPSERSNIGLPGRYRPVSNVMGVDPSGRTSTMSGAIPASPAPKSNTAPLKSTMKTTVAAVEEEDEEEGWAAMKAKRDRSRSMWRTKKGFGSDIGALIT